MAEKIRTKRKNESMKKLKESQSQEIAQSYRYLSDKYGVDLEDLVYGEDGFMKSCYPNGFPDFRGDIIYTEKYWNEFEKWLKEKKGITLKKLKQGDIKDENKRMKKRIKESKLNEAPDKYGIETDDEIEAKERAEFEKRLADRKAKAQADRTSAKEKEDREIEKQKKIDALKSRTVESGLSFEDLFDEFVPSSGNADSIGGELLRAVNKIEYRWWNDGDEFFTGYGVETCGAPAYFIQDYCYEGYQTDNEEAQELCGDIHDTVMNMAREYIDYTKGTEKLKELVRNLVLAEDGKLLKTSIEELDGKDMYSYASERTIEDYWEEYERKADVEFYIDEDVYAYVEKGFIDSDDIECVVEDWCNSYNSLYGNEVRWYGGEGDAITVYDVPEDLADEVSRWGDDWSSYLEELQSKYGYILDDDEVYDNALRITEEVIKDDYNNLEFTDFNVKHYDRNEYNCTFQLSYVNGDNYLDADFSFSTDDEQLDSSDFRDELESILDEFVTNYSNDGDDEENENLKEGVNKTVKYSVPEEDTKSVEELANSKGFKVNKIRDKKGYTEFEVVGDSSKESNKKLNEAPVNKGESKKVVGSAFEGLEEDGVNPEHLPGYIPAKKVGKYNYISNDNDEEEENVELEPNWMIVANDDGYIYATFIDYDNALKLRNELRDNGEKCHIKEIGIGDNYDNLEPEDIDQFRKNESITEEEEKKYYVYLQSPYGTELIGSGTLEHCKEVKEKKDAQWKSGYYWHTEILDHKIEEHTFYDSLQKEKSEGSLKESCSDKELIDRLVAQGICATKKEATERVKRMSAEQKAEFCKTTKEQQRRNFLNDSLKEGKVNNGGKKPLDTVSYLGYYKGRVNKKPSRDDYYDWTKDVVADGENGPDEFDWGIQASHDDLVHDFDKWARSHSYKGDVELDSEKNPSTDKWMVDYYGRKDPKIKNKFKRKHEGLKEAEGTTDEEKFLDSTINVYDIDKFIREETDNKYCSYMNEKLAIIEKNGKGLYADYEGIGEVFDSLEETTKLAVDEVTEDKNSISIFPYGYLKVKISDMLNAEHTSMKAREFFRKYKYNDRCASNFREVMSEVKKIGFLSESCINEAPIGVDTGEYVDPKDIGGKATTRDGRFVGVRKTPNKPVERVIGSDNEGDDTAIINSTQGKGKKAISDRNDVANSIQHRHDKEVNHIKESFNKKIVQKPSLKEELKEQLKENDKHYNLEESFDNGYRVVEDDSEFGEIWTNKYFKEGK